MSYIKPQITSLASASAVIQNQLAKSITTMSDGSEPFLTPAAYEADE
jgi:hypothetical protein